MHSPNAQLDHNAAAALHLSYRFRQASKAIAFFVAALGLVVVCGWAFNVPALTYIRPTFQSMKVNTALSFMCLGAGLWLANNDERQRRRRILGLLVVIIAGATLAEYTFHVSLGIDQLLFRDTRTPSISAYPGRMAIATAICFLLLGSAVTFLGVKKAVVLQRAPVHACFAFSLVALCGYLYGVQSLYAITAFSTVGLHTAAGLMAACLAYFLARPDEGILSIAASDSNSGFLLRILVPAIIVVPILIGWLRLAGQRANLYDTPFGVALLVLGNIGCLTILTVLIVRSMYRDEREREEVGEALKKSEDKFSKAFRNSPMVLTLTRVRDHRYLDVSESFEQWTGWRREEVIGRTPFDIGLWVHPAERSEFVKRVLAEGVVRNLEVRYRRKDGVEMVGLNSGELIGIGSEQCVISVIADINERKRAEEALKESENRFRLLADTAPVLIWMSGTDKLCTYFNKPWLDFTGRSIESELGNGWAEGVHSEDFQRCMDTYTQAFDRREELRIEYRLRRHDGEYRWILDIGVPRFNQECSFAGYVGIAVDVTERRVAEEALHELNRTLEGQTAELQSREELLKIFVKNAPVGVAMFDRDMRYLQVSDRWCADYGVDVSQILGRSHYEVFPDMPDRWKQIHGRALEGETLRADEDRWDREGGTTWIRWEVRPWLNLERLPGGILIFAEDITRRKRAEQALSDMTRKLVEAQEQERARIARELHDDITQRLAMLAIEIEQVQEHRPEIPSEVRARMRELSKSAKEISSDLQDLSHELHSSKLDYLGVVGGMKSWCNEFGERQGMEIEFKCSGMPHSLPPEITLCLFRVLQEALHNAARHSGVKRIDVQLREEFGEIQLIVSDLGKGFDVAAAMQGRGLGVTSMQERVRLVGGVIVIDSKPLAGTTIHVRVPFGAQRPSQGTAG